MFGELLSFGRRRDHPFVPNLVLWLDANEGVTHSGGVVSNWADLSGNGNDFAQSTASLKPQYVQKSAVAPLPVVRFDGTDDVLDAASVVLSGTSARTLQFVYRSEGNGMPLFLLSSQNGNGARYVLMTNPRLSVGGGNRVMYDPNTLIYTEFVVLTVTNAASSDVDATSFWVNGRDAKESSVSSQSIDTSSSTVSRLGINNTADGWLKGDVAEVLIYDTVLSTADRVANETYLANKWHVYYGDMLIYDEFTHMDATVISGNEPTRISNGNSWFSVDPMDGDPMETTSNQLYAPTAGSSPFTRALLDTGIKDYRIRCDLSQSAATGRAAIVFRHSTTADLAETHYHLIANDANPPTTLTLFRWEGSAYGSSLDQSDAASSLTDVEVVVQDNNVKVYSAARGLILDYTEGAPDYLNNSASQTVCGFRMTNDLGRADNFRIYSLPTSEHITNVIYPVAWQTFQRLTDTTGSIHVQVTTTSGATGVQAWFGSGATTWTTLSGSFSGNTFTGTATGLPAERGRLYLRTLPGRDDAIVSVGNVGIGEVFLLIGEGNVVGHSETDTTYTGDIAASIIRRADDPLNWMEMTGDPTTVASLLGEGSAWPIVANAFDAVVSVPIAYIVSARNDSDLAGTSGHWDKSRDATDYDATVTTYNAAYPGSSGSSGVRAILWHQGVTDASESVSTSTYKAALKTLRSNLESDLSMVTDTPMVVGILGPQSAGDAWSIRLAQMGGIDEDSNLRQGPVMYDVNDIASDSSQYFNDSSMPANDSMTTFGERWTRVLETHFFGGAESLSPVFSSAAKDEMANTVTVTFSSVETALVNGGATGWTVRNDTVSQTIDGISLGMDGVSIVLNMNMSADLSGTVDVSYGDDGGGYELLQANTFGDSGTGTMPPRPFQQESVS